jgi:hypothetical protein
MYTMKLTFGPWLWYVDIIDQFCGMLERADRVAIGGCGSSMGYPTKTVVFLHTPHPKKSMND